MKTIEQILAEAKLRAILEVAQKDEVIKEDVGDFSKLITPDFAFAMNQNMQELRDSGVDGFDRTLLPEWDLEELEELESNLEEITKNILNGRKNLKEELAKSSQLQDEAYMSQVRGALMMLEMDAEDIKDSILLIKASAME